MTQLEYDKEMQRLNDAQYAETHELREQLQVINNKNADVKQRIMELKMEQLEFSRQYHAISYQIHTIKQKYQDKKHALYVQRVDITADDNIVNGRKED